MDYVLADVYSGLRTQALQLTAAQVAGAWMMARFTYIWEFQVAPSAQAQFEFEYGPRGAWVELFRKAPGYIGTLLLRDNAEPLRYVTVDRWKSEQAHDAFRSANSAEYGEIDRRCQGYTTHECSLGEFAEFA